MKTSTQKSTRWRIIVAGALVLLFTVTIVSPRQSYAVCGVCATSAGTRSEAQWQNTRPAIEQEIDTQFNDLEDFIENDLWNDNILKAMHLMTEQLSAVAMHQMFIVGSFFDAKQQLETQQVFQRLTARAHKDYHPSIGLCEFGSNTKSLAASERKAEYNAVLMSQRSQDRSLGNAYTSARIGKASDIVSRIKQFREKFCDTQDNNSGLDYMCEHDQSGTLSGDIGAEDEERMNKDIDFVRTIDAPWTLNIDFTDSTLTDHEEEVLALASNLYSPNVFRRPPSSTLKDDADGLTTMQKYYMDTRAVIAKRSVAENSFNAIASMKGQGAAGSREFMEAIMDGLGVPAVDIDILFGDDPTASTPFTTSNPSYYAQMEVLTKKAYQNPDFYTNLYDTPANVERKGVAMQAIGLMQKFDMFKSYLRNEASLSVLLELAVVELQEEVENQFGVVESGGDAAD